MTTPSPPSDWGSRLLGTNGLQSSVDKFEQAVDKLAAVAQQMASPGPAGTSTSTFRSTGQTFTSGSFPKMQAGSFGGSGGSNVTQPGGGGGPGDTLSSAGSAIGGMAGSMLASSPQFGSQITMNQYAAMSTLGMAPGTSLKSGFRAMYGQAFGNYNSNLNALANNPADAAQMYSNLQGIAGSPFVGATALGRAGFGATAGFGYSNPALGGAGASQAAAQLYSGQTSMAMRMFGYGATPRAGIGQQNPLQMGQVVQSMLQRWYGKGSVNQGTLNAGLANNGRLQLNLKALGLDPNTMGPALQMYNKLFQQGVGPGQAQTLLNDAAHNQNFNGQSAQKILSDKYGIATSDLQKLKDTTAVKTGTTSGEMTGFDSAVSQATTSLQKFDTVLNTILKVTGLGTALGGMHGFSGVMSSVGGAAGSLFKNTIGMVSRFGGAGGITAGGAAITAGGSGPITAGGGSNGSGKAQPVSGASGAAKTAIADALAQVGKPYVWGGDSPQTSFDCSGLVEWAYGQAGVKLPRTSEAQWSALKNRSVPVNAVKAGDIVFSAGSDGSGSSPGHEALMISSKQIVEAPYTGANIRVRAYNPGEWQHAARPSGSTAGGNTQGGPGGSATSGSNATGSAASGTGKGNAGLGLAVGNYGSSNEVDNIAGALLGGTGGGGSPGIPGATMGSASMGNGQGSAGGKSGSINVNTAGGGSAAANRALGQKLAKQMYGWTGAQWDALDKLWGTYESGWDNKAQNPGSTAFGIAQFLDSTWKPYGPKTSSPGLQEKYGMEYIHDRYGDPVKALAFELSHSPHWYDAGTDSARRGLALVGERGPELVHLSGGQQIDSASKTADILKGSAAKMAQTPWSSGTAQKLMLANQPQNAPHGGGHGKCEVNLHMPQGAIVIHTNGSATDVSNNVRQIMAGISRAMADDETLKKIMAGVTS